MRCRIVRGSRRKASAARRYEIRRCVRATRVNRSPRGPNFPMPIRRAASQPLREHIVQRVDVACETHSRQ